MPVTVHFGLPEAQSNTLQKVFASVEGMTYLGHGVTPELDQANLAMGRPAGWEPAKVKPTFEAAIAAGGARPALLSRPTLATWRASAPRFIGGQLGDLFDRPKLLFVTRRAVPWAYDYFFTRLALLRTDAMAGLNPWIEKHMSQLRVGSDLAQVKFTQTVQEIAEKAGSEQVLVLPCEMLELDPAQFLGRVDEFVGLGGALTAKADGLELIPDNTVSLEYADAIRALRLIRRQRIQFLKIMAVFAERAHKPARARFVELRDDPYSDINEWVAWFRTARGPIHRAIKNGDEELLAIIPANDDYEMRDGLAAYLDEIEAEEVDSVREAFGIDLREWGYAPEPEPEA